MSAGRFARASALLVGCAAMVALLKCTQTFDLPANPPSGNDAGDDAPSSDCVLTADGTPCHGGICYAGTCCTGCWDGLECRSGESVASCGRQGGACTVCQDQKLRTCWQGSCVGKNSFRQVALSSYYGCGRDVSDQLWCWGENILGTAMPGSDAGLFPSATTVPGHVVDSFDVAPATTGPHTCVVQGQKLRCWGSNADSKLGANTGSEVTQPGSWALVAASANGTCGVKLDGDVSCWGGNSFGGLPPKDVPLPGKARALVAGNRHACAILEPDDALYCWGENNASQLGADGTPTAPVGLGTGWLQVTCGGSHTCAVRSDERLFCWGGNSSGQLGVDEPSSTVAKLEVEPGSAWTRVAAGGAHTCAVRVDGTLWCWGSNNYGQLGLGYEAPASGLQKVGSASDWKDVWADASVSFAINSAGLVYSWGLNNSWQLARPGAGSTPKPIQFAE